MTGSLGSFGCGSLHKEYGKGEWSAVQLSRHTKKERETHAVLMGADVRQKAVVVRGLCLMYEAIAGSDPQLLVYFWN